MLYTLSQTFAMFLNQLGPIPHDSAFSAFDKIEFLTMITNLSPQNKTFFEG